MVHTHSPSLDAVVKLAAFEIRNMPRENNIDSHQDCIYGHDNDDRFANLRRWHNIYEFYNQLHHLWMLRLQQAASLQNYDHDHDHDHKLPNLSYITCIFLVFNPDNLSCMHDVYSFNHDYHDNRVLRRNLSYRRMRNHPFRRHLPPLRGLRPTRGNREPHRVCVADSDIADPVQLADAAGARVADMGAVAEAEEGDVYSVWEAR